MNRYLSWFIGWIIGFVFWGIVILYITLVTSLSEPVNWISAFQTFLMLGPIAGIIGALFGDFVHFENTRKYK